jgi:hypothetical protein
MSNDEENAICFFVIWTFELPFGIRHSCFVIVPHLFIRK